MDYKLWGTSAGLILFFVFIGISYSLYLKPDGKQNQATLGLVIAVAVCVGIVAFLLAFIGLKGNAQAQLQFFIPLAICILLPTTIISATVGAYQLYGLREAIAANTQS
jgi:hypothetical protein